MGRRRSSRARGRGIPLRGARAWAVARLDAADAADQAVERCSSSSDVRNSTQVVADRKAGSRPRSGGSAPGSSTGMTRNGFEPPLAARFVTRRLIAARISSFCHAPKPAGPDEHGAGGAVAQGVLDRPAARRRRG